MNYKYLVIEEFLEFCNNFPEYSVTEVIFSILKSTNKSKDLSWLYEITDKELWTAIENANIKEKSDEDDEY